ncbi:hypothetical protein KQH93_10795, partial [Coprococcus comes]|nr:hypothetical protein [Coprococcus comes]
LCIIHLEPPVFNCFVYIRQDATQSYLEVLFYSIGAFNELQECSFLKLIILSNVKIIVCGNALPALGSSYTQKKTYS